MAKFSDIPYFLLEGYFGEILEGNGEYPDYQYAEHSGGYLFKSNAVQMTRDETLFTFYAKNEESDYKKIKADLSTDWNDEYNRVILHKLLSPAVVPSSDIKRTVTESAYQRITYNAIDIDTHGYAYDIEQGDGIYIRKDNEFVDWFKNNIELYRGFMNPEQPYIYIGNGYQFQETLLKIYYYALKDWMKDAIPENNRNDRLDEFFDLIYDQYYNKIYNMQKALLNIIDPKEVSDDILDNLYSYYDVLPLFSTLETYKRRLFLDNLIYFLKKKGTYSSVYIIWKILSANTNNQLTIYDRWHEYLSGGETEPYNYFVDYPYTNYYGGEYPHTYELSGNAETEYLESPFSLETLNTVQTYAEWEDYKVLSTHYKVEFDLNHNPMEEGYILSENMANDLWDKWEMTRPINRVSHYHALLKPISSFQEEITEMYDNPIYNANVYSGSSIGASVSAEDAYIHLQTFEYGVWFVEHNLDSFNLIVEVYDINFNKIYPKTIQMMDKNNIQIFFEDEYVYGFALVLKADYWENTGFNESLLVTHNLEQRYILPQFYKNLQKVKPLEVEAVDINNMEVTKIEGQSLVSEVDYVHYQIIEDDKWEVNHNLDNNAVITTVYDGDGYKIIPDNVKITGPDSCDIYFSDPISGSVAVKAIGSVSMVAVADRFLGSWTAKVGNGDNLDSWDYVENNSLKSTTYTVNCDINNFDIKSDGYYFIFSIPRDANIGYITEIGIFDTTGGLMFFSRVDNIYKRYDFTLDVTYFAEF